VKPYARIVIYVNKQPSHSPTKTNTTMKPYKRSKQPANIQATQLYYTEHSENPHHTTPHHTKPPQSKKPKHPDSKTPRCKNQDTQPSNTQQNNHRAKNNNTPSTPTPIRKHTRMQRVWWGGGCCFDGFSWCSFDGFLGCLMCGFLVCFRHGFPVGCDRFMQGWLLFFRIRGFLEIIRGV